MARHRLANAQRFLANAFFQKENLPKTLKNYEHPLENVKRKRELEIIKSHLADVKS